MRLVHHPVLCNYYVTYRCNASCGFCDIWERPSPYVTEENVRDNLRDLKRLGVRVIDFTGGEPLLHREMHLLLKEAKRQKFITTITSNGLLYPKRAEQLRGLVDMLHFSLDSPDEEEHNRSRNVNCFGHVMRSIEVAKELGERPDIIFTVTADNVDQIGRVYEEITRPNGLMLILNPVFSYNEVGSELGEGALRELEQWGRKKLVYLNRGFITLRRNGGNDTSDPACRAASTSIVISPQNELILPCYHLEKGTLPIEGRLYDLWHSPKVQDLVAQEGRMPECEGCTINCYFQPSFAVEMNRYWFHALPSTLKYAWEKGTWKQLRV